MLSNNYHKDIVVDNVAYTIEVFISGPSEYNGAIQDERIRNSDGFLLAYNITNKQSFDRVRHYYARIMMAKDSSFFDGLPITLVGTNCERLKERQVSITEASALATELGCGFFEASAKKGVNVEQSFHEIVRQICKHRISMSQYSPARYSPSKPLPQRPDIKEDHYSVRNQSASRLTPPTTPRLWDRLLGRYAKISGRISPPMMAAGANPTLDVLSP